MGGLFETEVSVCSVVERQIGNIHGIHKHPTANASQLGDTELQLHALFAFRVHVPTIMSVY